MNRILLLPIALVLFAGCGNEQPATRVSVEANSERPGDGVAAKKPKAKLPVEVAELRRQDVREMLQLVGTARPWDEFEVSSEVQGRISEIHFEQGQWVKKGDLLVDLDRQKRLLELRSREANLARARVKLEFDRKRLERGRTLLQKGAISESEVDALLEAVRVGETAVQISEIAIDTINQEIGDTRIYSPASGKISSRHVSLGETVGPSRVLFTIIQLTPIKVVTEIAEPYLHQIRTGDAAIVHFDALSNQPMKGKLHFVNPVANPKSGSFPTEIRLSNPGIRVQPGMIARVEMEAAVYPDALLAPADALSEREGRFVVFVVKDGVGYRREVEVVRRVGQSVILSGKLEPGDMLVTKGNVNIVDGTPVEVVS